MITYTPAGEQTGVLRVFSCPSAWHGIERYMPDIIKDFNIPRDTALEFGVDKGYSATVLANFFKSVTAVDTFAGDAHAGKRDDDLFNITKNNLSAFSNITVVKDDFYNFTSQHHSHYNLVHIDIVHEYTPTFDCADWAVQHSDIVLLHDTESFPEVKRVCTDIALKHNLKFYNFKEHFGLGILIK